MPQIIKLNKAVIKAICKKGLNEDLNPKGDITTNLINKKKIIKAKLISNQAGIVGGLLFAREALSRGCDVIVFGMDSDVADEIPSPTVGDIGEFVSDIDMVVYAGGGAFLPGRRVPGKPRHDFETDIGLLCELSEKRGVPLYALSVGGNGGIESGGGERL